MANPVTQLEMADKSVVHVGDQRKIRALITDVDDAASEPTQIRIVITPDNAPSSAKTYAKTAVSPEVAMTKDADGNYYATHTFTVAGWHSVVATGSGNMGEVEPARIRVYPVP